MAAILAFSGCGGSEPKSIEELQKLSKDDLKKMGEACKAIKAPAAFKLLSKNPNSSGSDLEKAVKSDSKKSEKKSLMIFCKHAERSQNIMMLLQVQLLY